MFPKGHSPAGAAEPAARRTWELVGVAAVTTILLAPLSQLIWGSIWGGDLGRGAPALHPLAAAGGNRSSVHGASAGGAGSAADLQGRLAHLEELLQRAWKVCLCMARPGLGRSQLSGAFAMALPLGGQGPSAASLGCSAASPAGRGGTCLAALLTGLFARSTSGPGPKGPTAGGEGAAAGRGAARGPSGRGLRRGE